MYQALLHKIHMLGATLVIVKLNEPLLHIKNPSDYELKVIREKRYYSEYLNLNRKNDLIQYYNDYYDNFDDIQNIYRTTVFDFRPIKKYGVYVLPNATSKYCNVVNNHRVTTDNPENYEHTIYFFGCCCAFGLCAEDKFTVESILQRRVNDVYKDKFLVVNSSSRTHFDDTCREILSPKCTFNKNDIIIIITTNTDFDEKKMSEALTEFKETNSFYYRDLSNIFQRPHDMGEIFFDTGHMSHKGYMILAKHIFNIVSTITSDREKNKKSAIPHDLIPYMNYLTMLNKRREKYQGKSKKYIGSLVMNCNPFTIGHKYLVEEALKHCDFLYVFILDEDKSFFNFDDRITMVKLGLIDMINVIVVPSGKTIISTATLPEYFSKDQIQDIKVDVSHDLDLFCQIIAPELHISKRFAGDEPFCKITRQYNEGMKKTLPMYGIEFIEFPRLAVDGQKVSASKVRKYIETNDLKLLKKIVPSTTYDFLKERHYIQ